MQHLRQVVSLARILSLTPLVMEGIKKWLLGFVLLVVALPMLQGGLGIVHSGPLSGEFSMADDVVFSVDKWLSGDFSRKKDSFLNDHIGFRPDMIRLNNELDYDLFDKVHSEWRLIGSHDCLFQDVYIRSYLGRDFDGYGVVREKVRKLRAIQDTLAKLGKSLVVVQPPCKAFYYPEYFPKGYRDSVRRMTNYAAYVAAGDSAGLNMVDFNAWFMGMKGKGSELMYPKQGFHWSTYGAMVALDSLERYMEGLQHVQLVHPVWTHIEHTTVARDVDDDIAQTMNVIFPPMKEVFSYPVVSYAEGGGRKKPMLLFAGDSFLFQWVRSGALYNISDDWKIMYYNRTLINKDHGIDSKFSLDSFDLRGEVDKADYLVIMYTSRNLSNYGFGFVEELYSVFYK